MKKNELKILISDDSILARKQLNDTLVNFGCPPSLTAKDGEEALAIFKESHPDIVFLDIVMPKKDGIDTIRDIVAYDPNAYIVMVSSVGTKSQLSSAIKAGASEFVQKPFEVEQINEIIRKFVERR